MVHERLSGGGIGGAQMLRSGQASMVIGGQDEGLQAGSDRGVHAVVRITS
jgi:hypothetical protein